MARIFKHIIITGASSGIGEALAMHYADAGVRLGLTGRNPERLEAVARTCRDLGAEVAAIVLDVTEADLMADWLLAQDDIAPVDLVIANAGISGGTGDQSLESDAQLRALFAVNVDGVFHTINPLLPRMMERGSGQVAIMSSLAGFRGFPGAPGYCASKAAVRIYGEGLRSSLRGVGVGVSVICPGFVESRMTAVNDYDMPFMMTARRAARIIAAGLARNKGRIAFPFVTALFAWLLGALPDGLAGVLLRDMPSKPASKSV